MFGAPVPGATIEVTGLHAPDRTLWRATSSADGSFASPRLPGERDYRVRAFGADTSIASAIVSPPGLPLLLRTFSAVTLRGTLRDGNGRLLAGRAVGATPLLQGQGDVVATTDAAGEFVLRHLPRGALRIVAAIPGQGLSRLDFLATADASVALVPWLGPTRPLHISVAELAPELAASTVVQVRPTTAFGWPLEWQRPALGRDGRCVLDGLPAWRFEVTLHRPGMQFRPPVARTDDSGVVTFRLLPPSALVDLRLTVFDENARPLPFLRLCRTTPDTRCEATTNEHGVATFRVDAAAGPGCVQCLTPSHVLLPTLTGAIDHKFVARVADGAIFGAGPTLPPDLDEASAAAVAAGTVRGRVLTVDGAPCARAVVWLQCREGAAAGPFRDEAVAATDANGTFVFPARLPASRLRRVRGLASSGSATSASFELAKSGEVVTVADLMLQPLARIDGVVRTRSGAAAPGIRVRQRPCDPATGRLHDDAWAEVVSDADGRYAFAAVLPGGALLQTLTTEVDSSARAAAPFGVSAGGHHAVDLTVDLP